MIRFRLTVVAQYGHFADVLALAEQLNEISRARGWQTARFFVPVAGENNTFVSEYDYPDLATCDAESKAAMSDPEWMKIFRSVAEHIYPQSGRTDILQEAPHLAEHVYPQSARTDILDEAPHLA